GVDLLAQIAWKETQPLARFDRRSRQHDALDRAGHHHVDRGGDGDIGLAGAGGAEPEHQLVLAQRAHIGRLVRAAGRDAALLRADLVALAPELAMSGAALRQAQRGVDRRAVHLETALKPLIERGQRRARHVGARARAGNGEPVAARDQGDAELPLDAIEILVALAEELGEQRVVVELHLHAGLGAVGAHALTSPERLLASAAVIRTGSVSPMRRLGAVAWTGCR